MPGVGFIFSLKEREPNFKSIKALDIPNLLLMTFCPQKELLNHPKVKLFFCHAGSGGVMESLYFGKPMLSLPTTNEQWNFSLRIHDLGVAKILPSDATSDLIEQNLLDFFNGQDKEYRANV